MRVLISAYACEPDKGSEPGVGWSWSLAAARRHDVWVMTRSNNREAIEAELEGSPLPSPRFVYVDLPPRTRFWKRGPLGLRLYYVLWQLLAARHARSLHAKLDFDVVHHLTFANMWLPAAVGRTGPPFVLGPVGGGQKAPVKLYRILGVRSAVQEILLLGARSLVRLSPSLRTNWKRASVILVNNDESRRALPVKFRKKVTIRPNACVRDELTTLRRELPKDLVAIYAGRFNRFKGIELGLRALVLASEWRLIIVGDGPDGPRLRRLAKQLGVDDRVQFQGWLPQEELWETIAGCRALLFPSLKEGAPAIVAEAQALGVPVVAFELGGVVALARLPGTQFELVRSGWRDESIGRLADALRRIEHSSAMPLPANLGLDEVECDLDAAYQFAVRERVDARDLAGAGAAVARPKNVSR